MSKRIKNPSYPKWWFAAFFVSVVCCVIGLAGCDPSTAPPAASTASSSGHDDDHEIEVAPATTMPGDKGATVAGHPVQVGDLEFTVHHATTGLDVISASDEFSTIPHGTFTMVTFTVKNLGAQPLQYMAEYVTGIASDGHEIPIEPVATGFANEGDDAWLAEIKPGASVTSAVVFDVEDGETIKAIVLRDVDSSTGATVVL